MGRNHVATGALVGLVSLQWVPASSLVDQVCWVVACGGTAMLNDLDTRQSAAARMWGPISGVLAAAVGFVARGHRRGTHDLVLAPVVFGLLVWVAAVHPFTRAAVLAVVVGLSIKGLGRGGFGRISAALNLLVSLGAGWWLSTAGIPPESVATVVALGVLVHNLGDLPTKGGLPVPILWIFGDRRRISLGLFAVNGPIERWVITPVLAIAVLWTALIGW